jgi:hypothetical protein
MNEMKPVFTHCALHVQDLERSVTFYREFRRLVVVGERGEGPNDHAAWMTEEGRAAGCLAWEPKEFPYPVGYRCALKDPDGYVIEFSYGQPLGPGA